MAGSAHLLREQEQTTRLTQILRELAMQRPWAHPLRIWVPECGAGQNVHAIAILLAEQLRQIGQPLSARVVGTTEDEKQLELARQALYPPQLAAEIPDELLERYFVVQGGMYQLVRRIRDICQFLRRDLLADATPSQVDLIYCATLGSELMHRFESEILPRFQQALRPAGYLVLDDQLLRVPAHLGHIDAKHGIYRKASSFEEPAGAQNANYPVEPAPSPSSITPESPVGPLPIAPQQEFLPMLAHELRNPLAALASALELLQSSESAQESVGRAKLVQIMARQVNHLSSLLGGLLDASRVTQGRITLHREPLDLTNLVDDLIVESRARLWSRGLKLQLSLPAEPISVWADRERMQQILSNLLDNAIRYTEEDGHISVSLSEQGPDAVLEVRDTGIGIPAELLPRVFDLFVQGERPLDRARGGLGIGLTIAKRLVELHGGTIAAASSGPGMGSRFTVRLPRLEKPPAALRSSSPSTVRATTCESGCPRRRVLVIEDNADVASTLALLLEQMGYQVRVASDGQSGLKLARSFRPHAILLDLGLPVLDGYQVAQQLRADPQLATVQLIALSGYSREEDRQRAAKAGFDLHLVKPVHPEVLNSVLGDPLLI